MVCNGIQAGDPNVMCVDVQIRAGRQVPCQLHLASADAAPILIAELSLPLPSTCLGPHIPSGSVSQQEVLSLRTLRPPQLGLAVNGSPDITSHAAQLASGCSHTRDQKPDNAPGQAHLLPSVTQEVMAVPAAPMVPAASGELNDPQATDTSTTLIVLAPDSYSAQGLENSLELHTAGPNTATTFTRATHPVPPPPPPQTQIVWDLYGTDGTSLPQQRLSNPSTEAFAVRKGGSCN